MFPKKFMWFAGIAAFLLVFFLPQYLNHMANYDWTTIQGPRVIIIAAIIPGIIGYLVGEYTNQVYNNRK